MLVHRTYLLLLHVLFVAKHGLSHPERCIEEDKNGNNDEEGMLNDRLATISERDQHNGKEGEEPVCKPVAHRWFDLRSLAHVSWSADVLDLTVDVD